MVARTGERRGGARSSGGEKRSRFEYKPREYDKVKKHVDQRTGGFDSPFKNGVDQWFPRQGTNTIRILPPTWDIDAHFGYPVWVHGYIGPGNGTYLCRFKMLGKPCPVCTALQEARKSSNEEEEKQLRPVQRQVYYILDREEESEVPQIYMLGNQLDKDIVEHTIVSKSAKVLRVDHPDIGYDLSFKRTGNGLNTRYTGVKFEHDQSPITTDTKAYNAIMDGIEQNPIPSLLFYHDVSYLENVISGTAGEDRDDDDDDDDDKNKDGRDRDAESDNEEREAHKDARGERRRKVKSKTDDDDDGEATDRDDDDDRRSSKRSARGRDRDDGDGEDEDESEDDNNEDNAEDDSNEGGDDSDAEDATDDEDKAPKRRGKNKPQERVRRSKDDDDEDGADKRKARGKRRDADDDNNEGEAEAVDDADDGEADEADDNDRKKPRERSRMPVRTDKSRRVGSARKQFRD